MEVMFNVRAQDNTGTVIKWGVFWGGVGGSGDTGICAEHFLYNENNLTNCSTQRNSPPIPHAPPPLLLHHHYITISKPWVQSKSSLSRMGARQREGGGEDKTEAVGVDPRLSLLLSLFGVYVCAKETDCVCDCAKRSACLLVRKYCRKSVEKLKKYRYNGSSTSCNEEKSIHIPKADNGAYWGYD